MEKIEYLLETAIAKAHTDANLLANIWDKNPSIKAICNMKSGVSLLRYFDVSSDYLNGMLCLAMGLSHTLNDDGEYCVIRRQGCVLGYYDYFIESGAADGEEFVPITCEILETIAKLEDAAADYLEKYAYEVNNSDAYDESSKAAEYYNLTLATSEYLETLFE